MKNNRKHAHNRHMQTKSSRHGSHTQWAYEGLNNRQADIQDLYTPTEDRHENVRDTPTAGRHGTHMKKPTEGRQDQYEHTTSVRQGQHETPHSRLKGQT